MPEQEPYVLIVYYSRNGQTAELATQISRGVARVSGIEARIRSVPPVAAETTQALPPVPEAGAPYASKAELAQCSALAIGSPTRFGNMAAPLKHFLDSTGDLWLSGALEGKPAGAFTSTGSLHGGQEATLLTMMVPLLHHGMVVTGLPYAWQGQLRIDEVTGGSPYGATTITGGDGSRMPSDNELEGARWQGRYVAETAKKLHG